MPAVRPAFKLKFSEFRIEFMWHNVVDVAVSAAGEISAEVEVPPESLWFSGHFPGDPILPGIAQLGIVYEAVCQSCGGRPGIAGFSRVKFRKIVRPGDSLRLSIAPRKEHPGSYAFRITIGGEIACSGNLALKMPEDKSA
jgi:3-hydroxymyristoyl/3-hydroxydecanoyl-(acyl carrier protein) dehydratase